MDRAAFVLLLCGGLTAFCAASRRASAVDAPSLPQQRVSVHMVGAPLTEVFRSLALADVELLTAPEFKNVKAVVVVKDRPLGEVMHRLAQVFGAEWRQVPSEHPTRYEFHRTAEVARWLREYQAAARAGDEFARKMQEETVARNLDQALEALDQPLEVDADGREVPPKGVTNVALARLIKSLPPGARQQLVRSVAESSPTHLGEPGRESGPAVQLPYRSLSARQQNLIRDWLTDTRESNPATNQRLQLLPETTVAFGPASGRSLIVQFIPPSGKSYEDLAFGNGLNSNGMERYVHQEQFRQLARVNTPEGALLGAKPGPDGQPIPAVRLPDEKTAGLLPAGMPPRPLYREFMAALADATRLNVVADYHTRRPRLDVPRTTLREILQAAAPKYEAVVRVEGGYLMARNQFWPDRDEEEIPGTLVDQLIARKNERGWLGLDDYSRMADLTDRQLDGLAAYADPPLAVLSADSITVRRSRWAWRLLAKLPKEQLQSAMHGGLPIKQLPPARVAELLRGIGSAQGLENARLYVNEIRPAKPGPRAAYASTLAYNLWVRDPSAPEPVWRLGDPPRVR